jgi:hypothetical protein
MTMEYQLVFSPNLNITVSDFIMAWNDEAEAQQFAHLRTEPAPGQAYSEPFLEVIWLVVSTVGMGLGTNELHDLLKRVIQKKRPYKSISIKQKDQPDGTHLLIIEQDEF